MEKAKAIRATSEALTHSTETWEYSTFVWNKYNNCYNSFLLLEKKTEDVPGEQFGFTGKITRDATGMLSIITERTLGTHE
jgi:hypothetical protein